MKVEYNQPVQYFMEGFDDIVHLNQLIGKSLSIKHLGYQCFNCEQDNPIFAMGYCRNCFFKVPQTQQFVIKPELSKAHLGEEEVDLEWEKKMQLQPHIVYLANTGALKVGVTRKTQVPIRWIDQGATQALPIVEVENRYLAGVTEVALAQHISDKTNYKKMLSNKIPVLNLEQEKQKLIQEIPEETKGNVVDETLLNITYPIESFPAKISSISFKKQSTVEGVLKGIKGQYLVFENGLVFNVRSHEGYTFELSLP